MERVLCPRHAENTPSCVVYPTYAFCYGGCGRIELAELGRESAGTPAVKFREDLAAMRDYIATLQTKPIRGFTLPYDDRGYYLQFPGHLYYKRRNWADGGAKYKNAAGHPQPQFWVRHEGNAVLCMVEGEFNAMSIGEAFPAWDVVSPGSASDFKAKKTRSFLLTYCTRYCTVLVVADYDGPGTEAAIHAKGCLLNRVPDVRILLMKKDANSVMCDEGIEALREQIKARVPDVPYGDDQT